MPDRLRKQMEFLIEIDKLTGVLRQTLVLDGSRRENSAEHSWNLALMAVTLAEYSADISIDVLRVIKMTLIHDLVEIDCGDTFIYDEVGGIGKVERERIAAERIFGLLPDNQSSELRALWEEFEARQTAESRFAAALDRLQPILHNYHTQGAAWKKHGITSHKVIEHNKHIVEGAPKLWEYALDVIHQAVEQGYLDM